MAFEFFGRQKPECNTVIEFLAYYVCMDLLKYISLEYEDIGIKLI